MQTISINSTAFNDAKEYATSHNLSVDAIQIVDSFKFFDCYWPEE